MRFEFFAVVHVWQWRCNPDRIKFRYVFNSWSRLFSLHQNRFCLNICRQMLRHAEGFIGVSAAGQQHHDLAGQHRLAQGLGHADVLCNLYARHRRDLAFRQHIAMPCADQLLLCFKRRARQLHVQCCIRHAASHLRCRQVDAQHRHASPHGRHHRRTVSAPRPAFVIPVQGALRLQFGRAWLKFGRGGAGIGHFQRHGCQQSAGGKKRNHLLLDLLVCDCIVLLAQQQYLGGQERVETRCRDGGDVRAQGCQDRRFWPVCTAADQGQAGKANQGVDGVGGARGAR